MSNPRSRSVALLLFLVLALPTTLFAEATDTAEVHGVVLDASGRPAAGYPMKVATAQWGEVIMGATEANGDFGLTGLPPGSYEFRVFDPGGSADKPLASKKVAVVAGKAERIEIRLGSDKGGGAAPSAAGLAAAGTLGVSGVNWSVIQIAGVLLVAAFVVVYMVRTKIRP
jgi:hypothetical protein